MLITVTLVATVAAGVQTLRLRRVQPCPPPGEAPGRYTQENERDRGKVDIVFLGDSVTDG